MCSCVAPYVVHTIRLLFGCSSKQHIEFLLNHLIDSGQKTDPATAFTSLLTGKYRFANLIWYSTYMMEKYKQFPLPWTANYHYYVNAIARGQTFQSYCDERVLVPNRGNGLRSIGICIMGSRPVWHAFAWWSAKNSGWDMYCSKTPI